MAEEISRNKIKDVYLYSNDIPKACEYFNITVEKFNELVKQYGIDKECQEKIQKITPEIIINEYYENNTSLRDICKKYHTHWTTLKKMMEDNDIKVKDSKHDLIPDEVYQYYVVEKHSQEETCSYFNVPYSYFRKFIIENNIKRTKIANKRNLYKGTYEDFYQYYVTESHTLDDTAKHFNIGYYTAQNYAIKNDMKRSKEQRLNNMYESNLKTIGSKTTFGTDTYKEWYTEHKEDIKKKVEQTCLEKYGAKSFVESKEAKDVWKMGTSKTENEIYEKLLSKYSDVKRWYTDERYPFECDFYIPSKDLFIEYQGFSTHGEEPFNENCESHLKLLKKMLDNPHKYQHDTVYIWTIRDPLKRKTAKENGLNYLEFFNVKQFDKWFENDGE
jgi:hypothetical protein